MPVLDANVQNGDLEDITGAFELSVTARFDALVSGSWQRVFDFGDGAASNNILLTQFENTSDLMFAVYQEGIAHIVVAHDALIEGEVANWGVGVDPDQIVIDDSLETDVMSFDEVNEFIEAEIGRKIGIVGACTGFDAHTVGIDAIMNMKGYNHHFGLERYPMIDAHNYGAQVSNERLIELARSAGADAILVSQVVTQKDIHLENLANFVELLEAEDLREGFIIIAGGPRIDNKLALEIGFDAGFGRGTYAEHVATFVARRMVQRRRRPAKRD